MPGGNFPHRPGQQVVEHRPVVGARCNEARWGTHGPWPHRPPDLPPYGAWPMPWHPAAPDRAQGAKPHHPPNTPAPNATAHTRTRGHPPLARTFSLRLAGPLPPRPPLPAFLPASVMNSASPSSNSSPSTTSSTCRAVCAFCVGWGAVGLAVHGWVVGRQAAVGPRAVQAGALNSIHLQCDGRRGGGGAWLAYLGRLGAAAS